MAIENTSSGTPWWPIGAALGLGLLGVLAVGAVFGARRGMFGNTLLSGIRATPASAVVQPRPPLVIPPEARAPALTVNDPPAPAPTAPDSSGGNGGGGGPSTDGGGNGYDPGTGSGNSTGGSGDDPGYSGSGTTPTQQPPPKPTTPPPPDFPPPNDAPVPPNAAPPIDGDLRANIPAWLAGRIGDISAEIAKFFADNSDNSHLRYNPSPKHDKSMPSRGDNKKDAAVMDLSPEEGQKLLENSVKAPTGDKRYGYKDGKVYEFQQEAPDVYHGYPKKETQDVPIQVLRKFRDRGDITESQYGKLRKGK